MSSGNLHCEAQASEQAGRVIEPRDTLPVVADSFRKLEGSIGSSDRADVRDSEPG
jgi:hypothetical protein